jgi:hypothetical protein
MTINVFKQVIELVKFNYNVIEIKDQAGNSEFWTCYQFDASTSSTSSSVDFVTFLGQNITELLNMTQYQLNPQIYIQAFQKYIEPMEKIRVKFGKYQPYFYYGK